MHNFETFSNLLHILDVIKKLQLIRQESHDWVYIREYLYDQPLQLLTDLQAWICFGH